jgi:hypothetical protein
VEGNAAEYRVELACLAEMNDTLYEAEAAACTDTAYIPFRLKALS